ncbi:MAG TPA: aa3-type cytochrome c oxidase subunit IV [Ferrovibrio sp.]|nr:aa3-type cytochrome c oxidase subunit IV [Ferrovibrio sp.]HLT77888.1 aa3-type cytochrome c oxidase subunit IV [Ferrovibrio sp.]
MAGEHQLGTMDISHHKATYAGFIKVTIWVTAITLAILALMAAFLA